MKNIKQYNGIHQWYYRGCLYSCNYSCTYCPFSKRPHANREELAKDEECLTRFVSSLMEKTEEDKEKCAVQIVPYGEAMVHK